MVFSFFKKQSQKMPERQAARPRAPKPEVVPPKPMIEEAEPLSTPLPDLEFNAGAQSSPTAGKSAAAEAPKPALADLEFTNDGFDDDFTESSVMGIDVEHGGDAIQSDIEHVVVLFANGQDAAARTLLENFVRAYPGVEGKRFWFLLFDLLQAVGDRATFEKLAVAFAEACETSPPAWRREQPAAAKKANGEKLFILQGVLTAEGAQPVTELANLIAQKIAVNVDCGKLIGCDDDVAGQLAELLSTARRKGVAVTLTSIDGFLARLNERLVAGEMTRATTWLLLLELLQRHGTQEAFEERAVDYAVTFELSPPSWEAKPAKRAAAPQYDLPHDDAYYFSGELKNCRFDDLVKEFEVHELPVLDFSGVVRMDFFSAGQLVNRIAPYKAKGREIVIRSPNHLIAELMAVVGLNKQARIIVPKS